MEFRQLIFSLKDLLQQTGQALASCTHGPFKPELVNSLDQ